MASLPIFISAVANSTDEPHFPILITWSTHDGQVKEVLVTPDDEWLHSHAIEPNIQNLDEQQLYEFGYEAQDILTEWATELDTDTMYAVDAETVEILIETLYDTKGLEPSFEINSIEQWFSERDVNIHQAREEQGEHTPLQLLSPDEQIMSLLQIAANHDLLDLSALETDDS
ncbi:hypothetical protein MGA5115_03194 [Marinomonas gallaica]|uniref:Uncharacterized protein n=1 Tax=Marinomonas gallaica TaxID=1806667 RepID=A0A1C3JV13_9GAMM|nr:hypothetical protein [Marinomonas gallaica]SBT19033.1 hypothetical protein MGA5115_03194 [Marinomonas gallaica]SBT21988.1 hypothetical protein MGA5116_02598 [Marinomonas gallaica]